MLGTWIIPAARRQPWQLARDLASLDQLSHGRVILGVGLGRRAEYDLFGEEWDSRRVSRRYDEALDLLSRFWSGPSGSTATRSRAWHHLAGLGRDLSAAVG